MSESKATDAAVARYEATYAAVPEAARRFAADTWGETWAHAEMGSLMEFAALASTARAGAGDWVTVPAEATGLMWAAGQNADEHPGDSYSAVYRAMIEAAPAVPASARSGAGEGEEILPSWSEAGTLKGDLYSAIAGKVELTGSNLDGYDIGGLDEAVLAVIECIRSRMPASPPAPAEHGVEIRELLAQLQDENDRALACQKRSAIAKSPDFAAYHGGRAEAYQHAARMVSALSQRGQANGSEKGKGEEDGRVTASPGSREPSPTVSASGFDPSRMADGCCSAVSPCSHQQRDPYSLCEICLKANRLAQAIEAHGAKTQSGFVADESAVPAVDAPTPSPDTTGANRGR